MNLPSLARNAAPPEAAASDGWLWVDGHYENFPVASRLLPRRERALVMALYRFARFADDLADEGSARDEERLVALAQLEAQVQALFACRESSKPVPRLPVVQALARLRDQMPSLGAEPFLALLSAFRQDVTKTRYANRRELLDYCARSAQPIGRVVLAIFGIHDRQLERLSDALCNALQLINFWQDAARDAERGRLYVPLADLERYGLSPEHFPHKGGHEALMHELCAWTLTFLREGCALLPHLPRRLAWEVTATIAGGMRILERIAQARYDVRSRPVLRWRDAPALLRIACAVRNNGPTALVLEP
ncbi:MAG: squalene synthase HpnC [Casimicrobiaceae bacterium]|nr:squalene synthase HpnC [Casimicrobiaceae bacterium]MCX8097858.1 squalene synthase HpnC [Casimicrobiaceae bacterium]MDW8311351.1 squalene synthase HpnC [Burkholderiales bacterium]